MLVSRVNMSQVNLKWMAALLVLAITVLRVSQAMTQGSTCEFCYIVQPPSFSDCNPFTPYNIKLRCIVDGPIGAALDIKWFYRSSATAEAAVVTADLPHNAEFTSIQLEKSATTRTFTSTATINNVMIGDYWCRVFHDGNALLISQMIGISGPDDYDREGYCDPGQVLSEDLVKCADIPLPSNYIQTAQSTATNSTSCPLTDATTIISTVANVANSSLRTSSQPAAVTPTSAAAGPQQNSHEVVTAASSDHIVTLQSSVVLSNHYYSTELPVLLTQESDTLPNYSTEGPVLLTRESDTLPNYSTEGPVLFTQESNTLPIAHHSPSSDLSSPLSTHEDRTWLFVVIGLSVMFLFLIIVLVFVFIVLCLSGPVIHKLNLRNRLDTITSPVSTDPPSRPLTSMTVQTDLGLGATSTGQDLKMAATYNPLDQDYEDIDDNEDEVEDSMMVTNPRYHEQGPTVVSLTLQPIYTEPTASTGQYSEIGNVTQEETRNMPTHGYGKLDHSANRPRQTYNPRINSPLLSGYRKLDHVRSSSTSAGATLPSQVASMKSPGYANISVPNSAGPTGCHHFRSISLPGSEYSNLNRNSNNSNPDTPTTPITPNPTTPAAATPTSKKYANFAIIEACDEANEEYEHRSVSRNASEDYQMLSDATTIDRSDPVPDLKEEYEFLPICVCEDEEVLPKSPDHDVSHHGSGRDMGRVLLKRQIESSLGREFEDQLSVISHSSSDFTGPFFFPHMANIEGQSTGNNEQDRHVYRALELSTMEPKQGYATVNVKES